MAIPEPKIIKLNAIANNEIELPTSLDYRSARVDEYFRSMELSTNSIRAYKRALTQFTKWTDSGATPRRRQAQGNAHQEKAWHLLKHQDLDRYKAYLKELELSNAIICQELAALKSFFNWLTIKDYISKDPTGATRFSWFLIKGDCAPRTAINGNRFDTLSRD